MASIKFQNGKEKLLKLASCLKTAAHSVKVWKTRLDLLEKETKPSEVLVQLENASYSTIQSKIWLNGEPQDQMPSLDAPLLTEVQVREHVQLSSSALVQKNRTQLFLKVTCLSLVIQRPMNRWNGHLTTQRSTLVASSPTCKPRSQRMYTSNVL